MSGMMSVADLVDLHEDARALGKKAREAGDVPMASIDMALSSAYAIAAALCERLDGLRDEVHALVAAQERIASALEGKDPNHWGKLPGSL